MHNVNVYVNTFSFSFKLLLGENIFFMEYLRATTSRRYPPEKLFRKFFKNSPENTSKLKESFFLMLQTLYLKLYKYAILTSMFSYKFWELFRTTFPIKTLCDYLWMGSIYSLKMNLQNTSKTLPKICDYKCSQYVENDFVNRNSSQPGEEIFRALPRYLLFC